MDINDTIMRLRDAPVHPRLVALDGAMLAKLASARVSEKTVETRLYRARQKLSDMLGEDAPRRV